MSALPPEALARALRDYLQLAGSSTWLGKFSGIPLVSGILDVGVKAHIAREVCQVPICVVIPSRWMSQIPLLYVNSRPDWLKTGADWHVARDGHVCLEWHERWADHLALLQLKTNVDIADIAAQWITRSAAHILHVHITCHALGKKKWPKGIPTWAHEDEARAQYRLEKRTLLEKSKLQR